MTAFSKIAHRFMDPVFEIHGTASLTFRSRVIRDARTRRLRRWRVAVERPCSRTSRDNRSRRTTAQASICEQPTNGKMNPTNGSRFAMLPDDILLDGHLEASDIPRPIRARLGPPSKASHDHASKD